MCAHRSFVSQCSSISIPLSEQEAKQQAFLLKALADPTRLRMLSVLSRHEGAVCVFELVECFSLEQPTISHHLRILRDAGLVDCRKNSLWAYYYVRCETLRRACEMIENLASLQFKFSIPLPPK